MESGRIPEEVKMAAAQRMGVRPEQESQVQSTAPENVIYEITERQPGPDTRAISEEARKFAGDIY